MQCLVMHAWTIIIRHIHFMRLQPPPSNHQTFEENICFSMGPWSTLESKCPAFIYMYIYRPMDIVKISVPVYMYIYIGLLYWPTYVKYYSMYDLSWYDMNEYHDKHCLFLKVIWNQPVLSP